MRYRIFPGKTILKIAILVVSLTFFTAPGIARQANTSQQPFTITISAENSEIKAGSDVCVEVSLTNNSAHDLLISSFVSDNGINNKFGYEIRFEGRDLIPQRPLPERFVGSVEGAMMKPNSTWNLKDCLNKSYDLTKPGKYTIQAVRGSPTNPKDGKITWIKSNIVTITVVP